jgi:hypothetical protein
MATLLGAACGRGDQSNRAGADAAARADTSSPDTASFDDPIDPETGRSLKAQGVQVQARHEGVEEANGILRGDVVVEDLGQEHRLGAIGTGDVGHGVELRAGGVLAQTGDAQYMEHRRVFTQALLGAGGRLEVR